MDASNQRRRKGGAGPRTRRPSPRDEALTGLPVLVPWLDAARRPTGPPRFLCDVMVDGLARQLRLVGVDAEGLAPAPKAQRHASYR